MMRADADPALLDRYFPRGVTDSFALELLDFVTAITTGAPVQTSADEGTRDLATAYAILESSAAGAPVQVEQVLDGSVSAYQDEIDRHYGQLH
jgi:predicted dehydrogenase